MRHNKLNKIAGTIDPKYQGAGEGTLKNEIFQFRDKIKSTRKPKIIFENLLEFLEFMKNLSNTDRTFLYASTDINGVLSEIFMDYFSKMHNIASQLRQRGLDAENLNLVFNVIGGLESVVETIDSELWDTETFDPDVAKQIDSNITQCFNDFAKFMNYTPTSDDELAGDYLVTPDEMTQEEEKAISDVMEDKRKKSLNNYIPLDSILTFASVFEIKAKLLTR